MNQDFNLEESQKRLMELLVSRTLKKYGVNKGAIGLSEKEKQNLRETVELLKKQSELLINQEKHITESDVDPVTNTYSVQHEEKK
jgi:spore coat protein W